MISLAEHQRIRAMAAPRDADWQPAADELVREMQLAGVAGIFRHL